MENLTGIFKLIEEKKYERTYCFLCGCFLNDSNKTVEHVIPKWLQKEFNLWDLKLTLINKTNIPYRSLTIPCCNTCNNKFLEPFERKVKDAYNKGFEDFFKLDRRMLFLWLGKIYYGILYKELFLPIDRKNPSKGNIITPKIIDSFYNHFLFLQGIRGKHKFENFFPASIYIFETQQNSSKELNWDLIDNHQAPFIAIRMKNIGIMALLQDCQSSQGLEEHLERYRTYKLHPLQFRELATQVLYKGLLFNKTPNFMNVQNGDKVSTRLLPMGSFWGSTLFEDWNYNDYAALLSLILNMPFEEIRPNENTLFKCLIDEKGEPIFMDINEN